MTPEEREMPESVVRASTSMERVAMLEAISEVTCGSHPEGTRCYEHPHDVRLVHPECAVKAVFALLSDEGRAVGVIAKALMCGCPAPYTECPHDDPLPDARRVWVALRAHLLGEQP